MGYFMNKDRYNNIIRRYERNIVLFEQSGYGVTGKKGFQHENSGRQIASRSLAFFELSDQ